MLALHDAASMMSVTLDKLRAMSALVSNFFDEPPIDTALVTIQTRNASTEAQEERNRLSLLLFSYSGAATFASIAHDYVLETQSALKEMQTLIDRALEAQKTA